MIRKLLSGRMLGVSGRLANVRLENVMWAALYDVARRKGCSVDDLVSEIDAERKRRKLGPAIRNHVVAYYRESARRALENPRK
jgi:predicted DNA-binding ribbon-helix-helix protein